MKILLNSSLIVAAAAFVAPNCFATVFVFETVMSGIYESPPNASPGIGSAEVTVDDAAKTMRVDLVFSGLLGPTTAAHLHAPTANPFDGNAAVVTGLAGFPLGVTSGTYDNTFDMADVNSYTSAFVTANGGTADSAFAALLGYMQEDRTYLNIHTQLFTGGEIKGFLQAVPEPATMSLLGLAVVPLLRRRKR